MASIRAMSGPAPGAAVSDVQELRGALTDAVLVDPAAALRVAADWLPAVWRSATLSSALLLDHPTVVLPAEPPRHLAAVVVDFALYGLTAADPLAPASAASLEDGDRPASAVLRRLADWCCKAAPPSREATNPAAGFETRCRLPWAQLVSTVHGWVADNPPTAHALGEVFLQFGVGCHATPTPAIPNFVHTAGRTVLEQVLLRFPGHRRAALAAAAGPSGTGAVDKLLLEHMLQHGAAVLPVLPLLVSSWMPVRPDMLTPAALAQVADLALEYASAHPVDAVEDVEMHVAEFFAAHALVPPVHGPPSGEACWEAFACVRYAPLVHKELCMGIVDAAVALAAGTTRVPVSLKCVSVLVPLLRPTAPPELRARVLAALSVRLHAFPVEVLSELGAALQSVSVAAFSADRKGVLAVLKDNFTQGQSLGAVLACCCSVARRHPGVPEFSALPRVLSRVAVFLLNGAAVAAAVGGRSTTMPLAPGTGDLPRFGTDPAAVALFLAELYVTLVDDLFMDDASRQTDVEFVLQTLPVPSTVRAGGARALGRLLLEALHHMCTVCARAVSRPGAPTLHDVVPTRSAAAAVLWDAVRHDGARCSVGATIRCVKALAVGADPSCAVDDAVRLLDLFTASMQSQAPCVPTPTTRAAVSAPVAARLGLPFLASFRVDWHPVPPPAPLQLSQLRGACLGTLMELPLAVPMRAVATRWHSGGGPPAPPLSEAPPEVGLLAETLRAVQADFSDGLDEATAVAYVDGVRALHSRLQSEVATPHALEACRTQAIAVTHALLGRYSGMRRRVFSALLAYACQLVQGAPPCTGAAFAVDCLRSAFQLPAAPPRCGGQPAFTADGAPPGNRGELMKSACALAHATLQRASTALLQPPDEEAVSTVSAAASVQAGGMLVDVLRDVVFGPGALDKLLQLQNQAKMPFARTFVHGGISLWVDHALTAVRGAQERGTPGRPDVVTWLRRACSALANLVSWSRAKKSSLPPEFCKEAQNAAAKMRRLVTDLLQVRALKGHVDLQAMSKELAATGATQRRRQKSGKGSKVGAGAGAGANAGTTKKARRQRGSKRKHSAPRSNHAYIADCLQEEGSGSDAYADLEDFIVND